MTAFTRTLAMMVLGCGALLCAPGDPSPAEIPEPSTWIMMTTGLGAVIYAARRRRMK